MTDTIELHLAPETMPAEPIAAEAEPTVLPLQRYAEAGRLGAHRVHQLIRLGRQYEEEHGLKSGRQRLRQLIQEGRRYEEEHGIRTPRPKRPSRRQAWADFTDALARIVQPAYRPLVERLADDLRAAAEPPAPEPA